MAFDLGVRYALLRKEKRLIPYRQDQTFLIYWIMEESDLCKTFYIRFCAEADEQSRWETRYTKTRKHFRKEKCT